MSTIQLSREGSWWAMGGLLYSVGLSATIVISIDDVRVATLKSHGETASVDVEPGSHTVETAWEGFAAGLVPGPRQGEPLTFSVEPGDDDSLCCGVKGYRFGRAISRSAVVLETWICPEEAPSD